MRHRGGGGEPDLPAGVTQTLAQVHVIEEDREALIHQTHLIEGLLAQQQRGGHRLLNCALLVVAPPGHAVLPEAAAAGEELAQAQRLVENNVGRGEGAAARLDPAVGPDEARGCGAGFRAPMHQLHEGVERTGVNHDVGVKQQLEGRDGAPQRLVVGGRVAQVVGVRDERDFGVAFAHHPGGAIIRGVVHDDDLAVDGVRGLGEAAQAVVEHLPRVPGDDAD